ncbi:MAG: hypothetical protein EXS14_01855 [Planctomycetes bacterium]|nr:hypothetical protein [Planctomycetota bacterium]
MGVKGVAALRWSRRFSATLSAAQAPASEPTAVAALPKLCLLVDELRRLARSEPVAVMDVAIESVRLLQRQFDALHDPIGRAAGLFPKLSGILELVLSGAVDLDRPKALRSIFELWVDDPAGHCADWDLLLLRVTHSDVERRLIAELLRQRLAELPLVLPPIAGAPDELRRTLLLAERHRLNRLMGEVLAVDGSFALAVLVAKEHWRRTGDVLDLLRTMQRAGMYEEALAVARRALHSVRTWQRERVVAIHDELVALEPTTGGRAQCRSRERALFAHPTLAAFEALRRCVAPEHWPRMRQRVLRILTRQAKALELVFQIHSEAGEFEQAAALGLR